jgi:hypothetical protein
MCFSSEVSLITFLIGIIGAYLCISLKTNTDKIIGYFFGFVALMQLIEFLLWNHQICDNYNKFLSIIGMVLNHLQPIVIGLLVLFFNKKIKHKWIIYTILVIYIIVIIPYSLQFIQSGDFDCTLKNTKQNSHLIWNWNGMYMAQFVYVIFTLSMALISIFGFPVLNFGIGMAFVVVISFVSSIFLYPQKAVGALWCFYTVFILFIYYLLRISNIIQTKMII